MTFEDPRLHVVWERLRTGEKLGVADAVTVYRSSDLLGIGQLANYSREQRHGNRSWCLVDPGPPPTMTITTGDLIEALLAHAPAKYYEPPLRPDLTGFGYLKDVATARLLLTEVNHIRVRLCPAVENVCQLALRFGADTLVGADLAEIERQANAAGREIV